MQVWSTGCSWTYGTGIQFPSENTYITHVIKHTGGDSLNYKFKYADAGHSNQYIFRTAIEIAEKMNKDTDILLVQWSSPFRQELVSNSGSAFYAPFEFTCLKYLYGLNHELYTTIGPKNIHFDDFRKMEEDTYMDIVKKYSKSFMNETYMELMSYNLQISLFHLLKSIGVKSLQFYGWNECKIKSKNIWKVIPENENFLKETFESVLNDNGFYLKDGEHPNKEMHKLFSKFLINKLQKLNYI
jgi:hypothetical protein